MSLYLKKYMWLVSLIAVMFCSYFLAKITINFVMLQFETGLTAPTVKVDSQTKDKVVSDSAKLEDLKTISDRNIFDSRDIEVVADQQKEKDEEAENENPTGEAVLTNLDIQLVSTFSVGDGTDKRSACVIALGKDRRGAQEAYTVGDEKEFAPQTRIVRILFDRVEFVNKSRLEYVPLQDFAKNFTLNAPPKREATDMPTPRKITNEAPVEKVESTGEGKFVIDKAEVESAINNLDKLYTEIRAVPYFVDGQASGLKLLNVKAGSLFSKLGLKRGHILKKINGMELDIRRGLEIFNQLRNETSLTLDVLDARGKEQTFEYEIR